MPALDELHWTTDLSGTEWLGARFAGEHAAVAPSGFEAYARLLHPARDRLDEEGRVRWREVAAWSGLPLGPSSPFSAIALPAEDPGTPLPCSWDGPGTGSLDPADAAALCRVLREHTTSAGDCWFCLWAGYDWQGVPLTRAGTPPAPPTAQPIPAEVLGGPHLQLPFREYLCYRGPIEHVRTWVGAPGRRDQTANLWWPADHAWCVATDIDFPWTYVGGSAALVDRLVGEPALEAQATTPGARPTGATPWVRAWVGEALEALLGTGHAVITTPVGTVTADMEPPGRWRGGAVRTRSSPAGGSARRGSGRSLARGLDEAALRRELDLLLTVTVNGLVGD